MFLFPPDTNQVRWPSKSGWRTSVWRTLLLEKLKTPAGFTIAVFLGLVIAWFLGRSTPEDSLIIMIGLLSVPVAMISFLFPVKGLIMVLIIGFFVELGKQLVPELPFGVMIDAMVLILAGGVLYRIAVSRSWTFLAHPVSALALAWICYCGLEFLNPWSRAEWGWLYAFRSIAGWWGILFVSLFAMRKYRQMISLHRIWIACSFIAACYGLVQWWAGPTDRELDWILSSPRFFSLIYHDGGIHSFSIFGSPGALGIISSLNVVFVLILTFRRGGTTGRKLIGSVLSLIFFLSLLASGSRIGLFLLPVGLLIYSILSLRLVPIILSALLLSCWAAIQVIPVKQPLVEEIRQLSNPIHTIGFQVRSQNQAWVQPFIQDHPIGAGLGTTAGLGKRFAPDIWLSQFPPDSAYIRLALETGWIGLGIFLTLLGLILVTGVKALFRSGSTRQKNTIEAYLCFCLMVIIASTFQQLFTQLPVGIMFILISGSLVTMAQQATLR